MVTEKVWYTVRELAELLHVRPLTAWRLVRPYRSRCHLARDGRHPRRSLFVPVEVVGEIIAERTPAWKSP